MSKYLGNSLFGRSRSIKIRNFVLPHVVGIEVDGASQKKNARPTTQFTAVVRLFNQPICNNLIFRNVLTSVAVAG